MVEVDRHDALGCFRACFRSSVVSPGRRPWFRAATFTPSLRPWTRVPGRGTPDGMPRHEKSLPTAAPQFDA